MTIGSVYDLLIRYKTLITVLVTRCIGALVVYGTLAYVTNSVSLKESADFIYFQNLLFLMCSIITLGLEPWYTKQSSKIGNNSNENISFLLSSGAISFFLFLFITFILVSTIYSLGLNIGKVSELFFLSISAFCMSLIKIYQSFYVGKHELVKSVFIEQISINVFLVGIIYFSHVDPVMAYQLSIILTVLLSTSQVLIKYSSFSMIGNVKIKVMGFIRSSELIDYGEILICTMVVLYFPYQYSKLFLGTDEVAGLLLCYKVSSLLLIFYVAMNSSIAKKLVNLWDSKSYIEFFRVVKDSTRVCVFVSIIYFFIVLGFGDFILSIFGGHFSELYWDLVIVSLGQCIFVSLGAIGYALLMSGYQKGLRRALRKNAATGLVIGIVLIPTLGRLGAALTILLLISGQHLFLIREFKAVYDKYLQT